MDGTRTRRTANLASAIALAISLVVATAAEALAKGAPPSPPPAPAPAPSMKGSVKGTVVDEDGKPVEGAKVVLEAPGLKAPLEAKTDAQGAYAFAKAPVGAVQLRVSAKARVAATVDVTVLAKGATPVAAATLRGAVRYAGKVTDVRGAGVPGAKVQPFPAAPSEEDPPSRRPPPRPKPASDAPVAETAADGSFALDGIEPAAAYDLRVTHPKFKRVDLPGLPGEKGTVREDLDVTLEDAAWIAGVVVDASGKPVAGAKVGAGDASVTTDALGRFSFGHLDVEEVSVEVRAEGYFPAALAVTGLTPGQGKEGERIAIEAATAFVAGTVVDSTGKPVAGASVRAHGDAGPAGSAKTDAVGAFRIERVVSREPVTLSVEAAGFDDGKAEGVALNSSDAKVTVTPAARLKVKVTDADGKVLPRVLVAVGTPGENRFSARPYEQGEEGIAMTLPVGQVVVMLVWPGFNPRQLGPYTAEVGKTVDAGTVVLERGG